VRSLGDRRKERGKEDVVGVKVAEKATLSGGSLPAGVGGSFLVLRHARVSRKMVPETHRLSVEESLARRSNEARKRSHRERESRDAWNAS